MTAAGIFNWPEETAKTWKLSLGPRLEEVCVLPMRDSAPGRVGPVSRLGWKTKPPTPQAGGTRVLFLQFSSHTIQLKIPPSATELFSLVGTHNMPNEGQGLLQKGNVANKTKLEEADAGGPARAPGDDTATKKITFEGLRRDGC